MNVRLASASVLLLGLLAPVGAFAQEAEKEEAAKPAAPAQAPVKEEHQWGPWPGPGKFQLRFVYHDFRLTLEPDDVRGTDDPINTGAADSRIDYDTQTQMGRVEAAYGLPLGETISLEAYAGVGWADTKVAIEAKNGSVINGGGPDVDLTADSEAHFVFSLGFNLRFLIGDMFFIGGGFEFIYGLADYDSQLFYDVVDINQDFQVYDVHFQAGIRSGFLSGWAGVAFLVYRTELDLDERGGPDRWDVELDQGDRLFKGFVGFGLHPGEHVSATAQFEFSPDPTIRVGLGLSF